MNQNPHRAAATCSLLFLLSVLAAGCTASEDDGEYESVTIPLDASVLREPLVNVQLPQKPDQQVRPGRRNADDEEGTPDQAEAEPRLIVDEVRFSQTGMRIIQPARSDASRVSGVKLLMPAEGDFRISLACKIHQLDPPTAPGAHGLSLRLVFRKSETSLIMYGCMSSKFCDRCLFRRVKRADEEKATQTTTPIEFTEGTWTVSRIDGVIALEVADADGEIIAVDTVDSGPGVLEATEIWCSRLRRGNGHAEIELQQVTVGAPELFPSEDEPFSYLPWIRAACIVLLVVSTALVYRSRR